MSASSHENISKNRNSTGCTIVSRNYFGYAKTLRESFLSNNPDSDFYILIVDLKDPEFFIDHEINVIWVEDLEIKNFLSYAMRYDILELNTNVKPTFLLNLISKYEKVVYIDPDIKIYRKLDIIFDRLENYSIVLTPHIVSPINDDMKPGEVDFLICGQFNLGFIGVNNDKNSIKMLRWWENRCLEQGYNEPSRGLFVDQKWINLVPCLFDNVFIEKSLGCNMAYWNLHERRLIWKDNIWLVNSNEPLYFFHFSGLDLSNTEQISKYQNRFDLNNRSDLVELFSDYRFNLDRNNHTNYQKIKYSFARFKNGKLISSVARRLYSISEHDNLDPFDSSGDFYKFCLVKRLFSIEGVSKNYNSYNVNQNDIRLKVIRFLLKILHKILGVDRYQMLLKYLIYISSIRNQRDVF